MLYRICSGGDLMQAETSFERAEKRLRKHSELEICISWENASVIAECFWWKLQKRLKSTPEDLNQNQKKHVS